MVTQRCEFLVVELGSAGRPVKHACEANEYVEVRDLTTRSAMRIKAGEVSPYRHTLFVKGRPFSILNVRK